MQMRVSRLRETLKLIEPAVPRKPSLAILKSILLKDGKAIATDLNTAVICDLPEATETCLIPFDPVMKVIDLVPGTEDSTIEVSGNNIKLSWPGGKAGYPTANPLDFPDVNKKDPPIVVGEVDGNTLVNNIYPMRVYAATEESRPVLKAVHLFFGEKMTAFAADGFRMVYQTFPVSFGVEGHISIDTSTIEILEYLWRKAPYIAPLSHTLIGALVAKRQMTMGVGNGGTEQFQWVGFKFGRVKVLANLVVGTPPDYKQLIPTPTNKVKVMGTEFKQAILRTRDIAKANSDIVRLKWTENEMDVYASSEEMGEVEATIPVEAMDGPGHIALNIKYLSEYLEKKEGVVIFGTTNEKSPIMLNHGSDPTILLMPMAVTWD